MLKSKNKSSKFQKNKNENKIIQKNKLNVKSIFAIIFMMILNIVGITNVYATNINSANIYAVNDCGKLLTYKGTPVKVTYVEYISDGIHYPAYCMDKTKPGAEKGSYVVSVNNTVKDLGLWRRIINGYPYKSIEQLGVANKEEAFTATKQAIYCYIHGNNPNDYKPIGIAGERTLNAMKKIINDAQNSQETKISSTLFVNKLNGEWKIDDIDNNFVSKIYNVTAGANIGNYKISLENEAAENLGGIKVTDLQNNEKSEFISNEKFKILIPIKELTKDGIININVTSVVETKPVLYGTAPDAGHQDYALTATTFENGSGSTTDNYYKNETKLIIVKQDQETGEKLENVEFQLLDKNKNVVYSDLRTGVDGKITIENLLPGEYYIKEVKSIDGYQEYDQPINIKVDLDQEITVTINNSKEEKTKVETKTEKSKSISSKSVKKLPVTGK